MPKISSWTQRTIPATATIDDVTISLKVRPNVMTPENELALLEAQGTREALEPLFSFFKDFVAEWDITDEEGDTLPICDAVLRAMPSRIIMEIIRQGQEAAQQRGK